MIDLGGGCHYEFKTPMNHYTLSRIFQRFSPCRANLKSSKMWQFSGMLAAGFTLLACGQAHSQVAVRLKMNKSNYILNEPVSATVFITNHAGRELVLRGTNSRPWLNFHLTSSGRVVPTARRVNYNAVVIPAGQTVSRSVSVSSSYSLGRMGNYTCVASVNMPGPTRNGFSSNRVHFTVTNGRTAWVQRAGIPDAPGEIREYKLLTFSGNRSMEIYAQVASANTGANICTIPLGKILSFRRPTATLDGANNMHALYQVKPNLFTHTCVSPKGEVLSTAQFKRGASGDPRLMTFGDGEVRVAGGVPFDAVEEAAKRKKIHGITERPAGVFNR
jgi:hypothetical protein